MVRDLVLNISECDLSFTDKSDMLDPIFDTVWGDIFDEDTDTDALICNIIVPEAYWQQMTYNDNELICMFHSEYMPDARNFYLRLVAFSNGQYSLFPDIHTSSLGGMAYSFMSNRNFATTILASSLPLIDIDGYFLARFVKSKGAIVLHKAYVYSAKSTDIEIDFSDNQASQLLSVCMPGKSYRYPTLGVGIIRYLNCVVEHSDLQARLQEQFDNDNKSIIAAEFDNSTGKLDVVFTPENAQQDNDLELPENLNMGFFQSFDDNSIRNSLSLNSVIEEEFLELLDSADSFVNLVIFIDDTTSTYRQIDNIQSGKFDADGFIVSDDEYYVVTAHVAAGTMIMFDNVGFDAIDNSPVFIVNGSNETRLYTSLVAQQYWFTEDCHKCCVISYESDIKYMITKDAYKAGKGLYTVPSSSENIKNMAGVVQDSVTGELSAVVSDNTNISDVVLEEITQGIYVSRES